MMDAVIDEVRGRRIRVGDKWLCDFASCNYLGFDLHPEIIQSVERSCGNGARIRAGLASSEVPACMSRSKSS